MLTYREINTRQLRMKIIPYTRLRQANGTNHHNSICMFQGAKKKSLKSLMKKAQLPLAVRIDQERKLRLRVGGEEQGTDLLGDLTLVKAYTEKFLICNAIKEGE